MNFHVAFHGLSFAIYAYTLYYDLSFVRVPELQIPPRNSGGKWQFLTFWNLVLQTAFYGLSVIGDLIANQNINLLKNGLFTIIIFPLALFVSSTFWGLYVIDRELVYPQILDAIVPGWLNQIVHTLVSLTSFLELYFNNHKYETRKKGILYSSIFFSTYIFWAFYLWFSAGFWVYPIVEVLNWPLRICFFAFVLLLYVSFYIFGEKLNNKLWTKKIN